MSDELVPALSPELATEIEALEAEIPNKGSAYWKGPAAAPKQVRYRDLLMAKRTGSTPARADALSAEKLAIEAKMADRSSAYYHGPKVDGETAFARRYRQILGDNATVQAEAPAPDDSWRASPAAARPFLAPSLVAQWGDRLGACLRKVQDVAVMVLTGLDHEAQRHLASAFDGLGPELQGHVYRQLAEPAPAYTKSADASDLAVFRLGVPGADQIMDLWGTQAPRRVGLALDRLKAVERNATPAEVRQMQGWWSRQPDRDRQLMAWALGN